MESLAIIASKNLQTSKGTEKITSDSSAQERREALYYVLTEYRETMQYQPLTGDEMEIRIASWLPITAPIPANRLHDCYVWAMQNRSSQFPLSAVEMVDAWKHLVSRGETEGSSGLRDDRLLPERAATACPRCYKKRGPDGEILECLEIHIDGSIGGPCDHRPFTEEEKRQAEKMRADMLMEAQRATKERLKIRHEEEIKAKEEDRKPKEHHLHCSECDRRVSTLAGWESGETCGVKLDKESEVCPKCKQPAGVLSLNKMVCLECFSAYEVVTCQGQVL